MLTFGITGGIACGKSTVSKIFIDNGIPIVDADQVARDVVILGSSGLKQIINVWGEYILNSDGTLDRKKLGDIVFKYPKQMNILTSIMNPLIEKESSKQINQLHSSGSRIVGYDSALLIESGKADEFRPLVVVHCAEDLQIERLMKRNDLTREQAMLRIEAQLSVKKKVEISDYTINTSGSKEETLEQTLFIINKLQQ